MPRGAMSSGVRAAALLCAAALPAFAQDADPVEVLERRTQDLARAATPAIVSVTAVTEPSPGPHLVFPGLRIVPFRAESERFEATGFVTDLDGTTGTVATTIELLHETARYEVRFADGTVRPARLLGADEPFHVAVLRVEVPDGTRAFSDAAADVPPGSRSFGWLFAAVSGAEPDVQLTAVRPAACPESTYDRYLAGVLTLRSGGAGGPMLARDGKLLGMAVGSVPDRASLPAAGSKCRSTLFVRGDDLLAAVREIARSWSESQPGRVRHARLGVLLDADSNRVDQLLRGAPAEIAGLREGDEIVSLAGTSVTTAAAITRGLLRRRPGETVPIEVRRGSAVVRASVTLDDVALPTEPTVAPLPGVVLEMSWRLATGNAPPAQVVALRDIEPGSALDAAGALDGDELVSVDGMDAFRFLSRHRVRPAASPVGAVVVRRGPDEVTLTLPRR